MHSVTLLPIDLIRTDAGTQMRVAICAKTLTDYVDTVDDLPPITVFLVDGKYILADGFHRLGAYKCCGRDTIPCEIKEGTLDDVREFACCANITHGLRRSDADKRKAVEEFFKIPGREDLTNSEVSRKLNVSPRVIKDIRNNLGVKASPASHHGAGSAKWKANTPIKPTVLEGDTASPLANNGNKTVNVDLPIGSQHEFAVTLFTHLDQDYVKTCAEYIIGL